MSSIYTWVKNIVCFMCILNLILQILPGKSYHKYVHFFGGVLLIIIVLNPLADLAKVSAGFEQVWRTESIKEELQDLEVGMQGIEELRTDTINDAYKAEIERQIEEIVMAYGFTPKKTTITYDKNEDGVLIVKFVNLEVSWNSGEKKVSGEDITNIKNEIKEIYHILAQNINIIVQE